MILQEDGPIGLPYGVGLLAARHLSASCSGPLALCTSSLHSCLASPYMHVTSTASCLALPCWISCLFLGFSLLLQRPNFSPAITQHQDQRYWEMVVIRSHAHPAPAIGRSASQVAIPWLKHVKPQNRMANHRQVKEPCQVRFRRGRGGCSRRCARGGHCGPVLVPTCARFDKYLVPNRWYK